MLATKKDFEFSTLLSFFRTKLVHLAKFLWSLIMLETGCMSRFVPQSGEEIDHFHKWLPIINSFVIIKISLTNLVFDLIIQKNFYSQASSVRLI